jgi:hypothetical protein
MAVCLLVKELSEFWGIDEVPIVGETQSIRGVNIERLRLRWCLFKVSEEELPQKVKKRVRDRHLQSHVFVWEWDRGQRTLDPAVG